MNAQSTAEQLQRILSDDLRAIQQLNDTILEERTALKNRQIETLDSSAKHKHQLSEVLRKNAKLKAKVLQASGQSVKPGEASAFISRLGVPKLVTLHQAVQAKLKACQQENLVNGRVIQRSQQRSERLLSILRGQGQNQQLYGKYGSEQNMSASRSIAQA